MEIKQAAYFLKVVETGSFSAAADALYLSQSSLSKQIIALEKELGFILFDRSKRKIGLTAGGKAFLPHAQAIEADYSGMLKAVAPYKAAPTLSIVSIPVIAQYGISAYIGQFGREYPEVRLALDEREAVEVLPLLTSQQYDLAFLRDNYLDKTRYACIEVASDRFAAVLSTQHRLAGQSSLALADLANENFIMFDKGTVVHELAVDACRAAGFEPRIFYASLRVESILGLVASNSGVALMMQRLVEYHKNPGVEIVPLQETIGSRLVLAWPKEVKPSKALVDFTDFITRRIGG
ncbi:MAG: LysR family transcriptional regulator [Chloroflexota bacterium]